MFEVKDSARTLQFNGKLLSESSSWRRDSTRWIEFALYKTDNGSYVLSRIGVSIIYHGAACPLVKRYSLSEINANELRDNAIPCLECNPSPSAVMVFPEKYRYWAQVSDGPEAVLDALYKQDVSGARYLTHVAQRLLEDAAEVDVKIDEVYKVEVIP